MILKFLRLLKILTVIVKYGLDEIAISGLHVPRTARLINTVFFWRRITSPRAIRLRLALEELGPIFVKFGQVLSTRPDLMPPDIVAELSLPPVKIHCSVLAEDAIKAAIADYKSKQEKDKGVPASAGHAQPNA